MSVTEFKSRYRVESKPAIGRFQNVRLRGYIDSFDGVGEVEFRKFGDSWLRIIQTDEKRLDERTDLPKRDGSVARYGSEYDFRLVRKTMGSPYQLVHLEQSRGAISKSEQDRRNAEKELRIGQFARASYAFYGKPLETWLDDETFKVLSVRRLSANSPSEQVEVTFDMEISSNVDVESGKLVLLPSHGWAIRSFEIYFTETDGEQAYHGVDGTQMKYTSELSRETCIPDTVEIYVGNATTGERKAQRFDVTEVEFDNVSSEELSLASFGFPEVSSAESHGSLYWLLTGGASLIALSLLAAWWSRKRKSA